MSVQERLREGAWHYETITPDLVQAERVVGLLYEGRTAYQHVAVQDTACFGRSLVLDDKTQSTAADEFIYHEALTHPAMLAHPNPRDVFIAGGGEGATARETLAHNTVQSAVMVDLDREVVELCRQHLPDFHRGAFDDPRLELIHADAYAYLEQTDRSFDVAIIDVPDPLEEGPALMLFTVEFYRLLRSRLNPGGIMVAQSGPTGPAFYEQCFSAVANTIGDVFPQFHACEAFVPSFGSTWGFALGSLGPDPTAMGADEVDALIERRVDSELRYYDGITHRGMFSLPKYMRAALAAETRTITRDNPIFVD